MIVGIPKEARTGEHRVALTPSAVKALAQAGNRVFVETGAGHAAGHPDADYQSAGAEISYGRMEAFARAGLVASVQAPEPREYELLQPGQAVIAFWGLPAARPEDVRELLERRVTAVGLEAIEDDRGRAPVLTSMSEIAGALAVTVGGGLLLNEFGGKGMLLGGVPGVPPAHLVILGAGVLGRAAARAGLGAGPTSRCSTSAWSDCAAPCWSWAARRRRCWRRGRTSRRRSPSRTWCWAPWRSTGSAHRSWSRAGCCA